tara:strand:+ start:177 stop:362 length:186 start_codon:yes stop_codon:yes gene_type:complete
MICKRCNGSGKIEVKTIYPIFFMPAFAKVEVKLISCPNCEDKADGNITRRSGDQTKTNSDS